MNKLFILLVSVITLNLNAQNTLLTALTNTKSSSTIEFKSSGITFENYENEQGVFTRIIAQGMTESYDIGNPNLPVYSKLIELPHEGGVEIELLNKIENTITLADEGFIHAIEPAQRSIFKNEDPLKVPFVKNELVYLKDAFYTPEFIKIERLGIMRGKSIARVQIAPFAYNPLTSELKIIESLQFKINFEKSIEGVSEAYSSKEFQSNFSKLLNQNFDNKAEFNSEPTKMLIVSDPMFQESLQDFIAWKKRKGFEVLELYTGADGVGLSFESIKASIQEVYEGATDEDPAPTYLLIVGDHEQIPGYDTGDHVSDMYYCEFDGNGDYFPEMFFGRFSANSVEELMPQINKTLQYEQYSMSDPSYLDEMLLVAGVDSYFAPTHGNGQINYGTDYYFNEEHNFETYTYLYPESETGQAEEAIIEHVSQGVGFANYTAHCSSAGWSDPSFEVWDIEGLQNEDEYGLMIGNCCQSNTFNGVTCFGEALLRTSKGGAVGYIGGSNNTLWDEDFYWGVGNGPVSANPSYEETSSAVYDCGFHENGESESQWAITQGQMIHAGNWAVSESSSDNIQYYWEIYHLMGDPSVKTYFGVPTELAINHPDGVITGSTSLTINTETHTYVAVSQEGVLLDASYTDSNGNVQLDFPAINSMEPLEIVATKQNRQPYFANVSIISLNAPYVAYTGMEVNDGAEGNGEVEVGESFSLNIDLQNYGLVDADVFTVEVSSSNPNVLIVNNALNSEGLPADSSTTIVGVADVVVEGGVQDQQLVNLEFVVTDVNGSQWTTSGSFVVNAPQLMFSDYLLEDENTNQVVDYLENANLHIVLTNEGHLSSLDGVVNVTSDFEYISILEPQINFDEIGILESTDIVIPVILSDDAPAAQEYIVSLQALSENAVSVTHDVFLRTPECAIDDFQFSLVVETDEYGYETAWSIVNTSEEVLGAVEFETLGSEQIYEQLMCAQNNSYLTFEIQDSYGDGLLTGGYSIIVCGDTIASGADFNSGEVVSFIAGCDQTLEVGCTNEESSNYNPEAVVDDGSCLEVSLEDLVNSVHIYPNPAQSRIHFQLGDLQVESILLLQADGKEVLKTSVNDSNAELNVESLDSGYYLVKIKLEDGAILSKSIIVM